jgi:tetratricopeptide (TPR) repeat protein
MVTEAFALAMRALLGVAMLLATVTPSHASDGADDALASAQGLARAQALYAQQRYREAVDALEALAEAAPPDARVHLLLGKAHSRMAERAPWYRAMIHARRCGIELARAVELDPHNRDALVSLARFYEEAPALVGGGADKAAPLRARLQALDPAPAPNRP